MPGAHLLLPQIAGCVEGDAEQVAVAVGPDRGVEAFRGERIAGRGLAVRREPQHLAERGARVLRRLELLALAVREEQVSPVGREGDAPGIVAVARHERRCPKQGGEAFEPGRAAAFG
jgi:hypothetical protein